jgi:hypothetical protein
MDEMDDIDTDKIDQTVLALLQPTLCGGARGRAMTGR